MLIKPLIGLGNEIKIKHDYSDNLDINFYSNFYLDKFKYIIDINKKGISINIFYGMGKVHTTWFREQELLIDESRNIKELFNKIQESLEIKVGDKISFGDKIEMISDGSFQVYKGNEDIRNIEGIKINGNIEFSYHPISGKRMKGNYEHEYLEFIIGGNIYNRNDFSLIIKK